jgi:hypothetical protein
VRINHALENTLRTPDFIILHIQEWPTSRMAEWPETPQIPAPLRAWDVTVQVLDGSKGPEHLCLYLDAFLSVLPAATSEDDQDDEQVSCVTRSCPCCPGTLHREHDDATPYQVHAYSTWKCDRCTYQDRADVLGNPQICKQSQDRS